VPANALLPVTTQRQALHNLPEPATQDASVGGVRRVWGDAVELWTPSGMAQSYPVGAGVGQPVPYWDSTVRSEPRRGRE
jgi:hypothetical protein